MVFQEVLVFGCSSRGYDAALFVVDEFQRIVLVEILAHVVRLLLLYSTGVEYLLAQLAVGGIVSVSNIVAGGFHYFGRQVEVVVGYRTDVFVLVGNHAAVGIVRIIVAGAVAVYEAGGCIAAIGYTEQLVALGSGSTVVIRKRIHVFTLRGFANQIQHVAIKVVLITGFGVGGCGVDVVVIVYIFRQAPAGFVLAEVG